MSRRRNPAVLGVVVFIFLGFSPLHAQCLEGELAPSTLTRGAGFQGPVAIYGDRAIVGMPGSSISCDSCDDGIAVVYRYEMGNWIREAILSAPDWPSPGFGSSVAIHGKVAICGAPNDRPETTRAGAVYVFRRLDPGWSLEAKLTASDAGVSRWLGSSVALHENVIATSAGSAFGCCNAVYVFRRTHEQWAQEARLTPSGFEGSLGLFGDFVVAGAPYQALSDLGCPYNACYFGSAHVFRFDGAEWRPHQILRASPAIINEEFGSAVDIHGDRILVGTQRGSAYTFLLENGYWSLEQKFQSSVLHFGRLISLSDQFALIGGTFGAFLFRYDAITGWQDVPEVVVAPSGSNPRIGAMDLGARDALIKIGGMDVQVVGLLRQPDVDGNGVNDGCQVDCNNNAHDDAQDIYLNTSVDCNRNAIPDECEPDCNKNGIMDTCDLGFASRDCNRNSTPDECDTLSGASEDCSEDGIPDECDPDCNENGAPDTCDIVTEASADVDANSLPDECESWTQCVSDGSHFDYGPHRANMQAEFLAMLISDGLRAPDEEYDRIVRDLNLLDTAYPILKTVDRLSKGPTYTTAQPVPTQGLGVYLDANQAHNGYANSNEYYQVTAEVTPYPNSSPTYKLLSFCDTLNIALLKKEYEALPEVLFAEGGAESGFYWGGDFIDLTPDGDSYAYLFANGGGDCPSGCTCWQTWRFAVTSAGAISILSYDPGPCDCFWGLVNLGDFDNDGVMDCLDPCAAGQDAGPVDTDTDGVGDVCDRCPFTISAADVDAVGCPPPHTFDADRDGDIALDDFGQFQDCLRGVWVSPDSQACYPLIIDGDFDVDLWELAVFQRCFSGSDSPFSAPCN